MKVKLGDLLSFRDENGHRCTGTVILANKNRITVRLAGSHWKMDLDTEIDQIERLL